MNSVDVSRQERELLKEFLKAEDKLTVYPMLCEFHNSLFNYLTLQLPFKFLSDLNENEKLPEFLKEVYFEEEKFVYLEKVFDSKENGYEYHVKIFRINYEPKKDTQGARP